MGTKAQKEWLWNLRNVCQKLCPDTKYRYCQSKGLGRRCFHLEGGHVMPKMKEPWYLLAAREEREAARLAKESSQ